MGGHAQSSFEAEFDGGPCPFEVPAFLEEGDTVNCGTVEVPLFHADPSGDTIELAVTVLPGTRDRRSEVPLIILTGGPGQPSAPALASFDPDLRGPGSWLDLLERQPVVLFDQRGTGYSQPGLYCATDIPPGEEPPAAEAVDPEEAAEEEVSVSLVDEAEMCRETLEAEGIDPEAFTTAENAADIDDLRVALGVDQVDLLGVSYGSRLALVAMRDFPRSFRSVILDSPLPLQADQVAGQIVGFDDALTDVFAACADDPDCVRTYGDVEALFSKVVDELERDPLQATFEDPTTGDDVDVPVDGETFVGLVYLSVFVGPLVGAVPALIATADAGGTDVVELILPLLADFGGGFSTGMQLAINCQDEINFSTREDAEAAIEEAGVRPEIASGFGLGELGYYDACLAFDVEGEGDIENEAVGSDIPTLIFTGRYDPITPTEYGELALETLENGQHVDIGDAGHDPLGTSPCAVEIAVTFLDDPAAPVDDSCAQGLEVDFSP